MESDRLDAKDPCLVFGILKGWMSNSFHKVVQDTKPPGCPWQTLAMALEEARRLQGRDEVVSSPGNGCLEESLCTEQGVRSSIVQIYQAQSSEDIRAIVRAKLRDPLSYFSLGMYRGVDDALEHWDYYLYCLTFEAHEFTTDGVSWNSEPDENKDVIRMPMDFVDLHFLARYFNAQITVSQYQHRALRFVPEDTKCHHALHFAMHKGMWAPLLYSRPPELDAAKLIGSVVELGKPLRSAPAFAGHTACVVSFDYSQECYVVCVGQHMVPVERQQIKRIICLASEADSNNDDLVSPIVTKPGESAAAKARAKRKGWAQNWGPGAGDAPPLRGIPDGSVEFSILFDLVDKIAEERVAQLRNSADCRDEDDREETAERETQVHGLNPMPAPRDGPRSNAQEVPPARGHPSAEKPRDALSSDSSVQSVPHVGHPQVASAPGADSSQRSPYAAAWTSNGAPSAYQAGAVGSSQNLYSGAPYTASPQVAGTPYVTPPQASGGPSAYQAGAAGPNRASAPQVASATCNASPHVAGAACAHPAQAAGVHRAACGSSGSSAHPGEGRGRITLTQAVSYLNDDYIVYVQSPNSFEPSQQNSQELLSFQRGDRLTLFKAHVAEQGYVSLLAAVESKSSRRQWVLSDHICLWRVHRNFDARQQGYACPERFLQLREGQTIVMTERTSTPGWAKGWIRSDANAGERQQGLLPLACVTAEIDVQVMNRVEIC
eukprot:TRINITY_DN23591_c0_g2_i1.p1 TRINITY_DN23591_c0_g2~~TRINITY_DN23591_c0_g2_i1.p1  ORF type:complete len:718 (-),score=111.37 TRINITY_DN23591_c0_g2_i1:191-2344(-)